MKGMNKSHELDANESHSWFILVTLIITGFVYQWNVLYSTITTPSCNTYHVYWFHDSGSGSPFYLTALSYILIGIWSLIELLLACFKQVSDRFFAIIINIFIIASVIFSLYSLHKLDDTLQFYPLLYKQHMKDEGRRKALEFDQRRNCPESNHL